MNHDDFAAVLLDPALPCPPGVHARHGADPAARLAVHRNHVVGSLIDALAGDAAPVSGEAVGAALADVEAGGALRLVCHPSVWVLESAFAVASLGAAHQIGDHAEHADHAAPFELVEALSLLMRHDAITGLNRPEQA